MSTAQLRAFLHAASGHDTQQKLLALLRETAQPVAVVTSFMTGPPGSSARSKRVFHGATLSSFTSIAMDPHPLVTFALRLPSRMATALESAEPDAPSHMVVNLLCAEQAALAVKFSRPDLYPEPFKSAPYTLTEEGLPVLEGSLGALSCKLVSSPLPLHDLQYLRQYGKSTGTASCKGRSLEDGVTSELFIAQVVRVEDLPMSEGQQDAPRTLPLLYHRRGYTSCQGLHSYTKSSQNPT
ncbi:hypothetical protein BDN72DRAFT_888816 [Pluteus cervinus]|uniref:Uncharacterized protein n=1 Tax=Pluteus cervinus TaxID=181527 RepID=A0ACD3AQB8_9AGAR|nr:hypothetical protein BDN72DRAFT_888816 [Pluteus cervinus]